MLGQREKRSIFHRQGVYAANARIRKPTVAALFSENEIQYQKTVDTRE
jgi:hypothetical protein